MYVEWARARAWSVLERRVEVLESLGYQFKSV